MVNYFYRFASGVRINWLVALCFLLVMSCYTSVSSQAIGYTDVQKTAFVEVYMESKATADERSSDNQLQAILDSYAVTPQRYRYIFATYNEGDRAELTPREVEFVDQIQVEKKQQASQKQERTKELCLANHISYQDYKAIRKQYLTDIAFQRSLASFFQICMKR